MTTIGKNDLDNLLESQMSLMEVLGIDPNSGTLTKTGKVAKSELGAAIGITCESAEILELVEKANRKWKPDGDTASSVKEELIDVLFFTLELAVLLGLTGSDLKSLYHQKFKKNLMRLYISIVTSQEEVPDKLIDLLSRHLDGQEIQAMMANASPNGSHQGP